jgi:hypothetical protein
LKASRTSKWLQKEKEKILKACIEDPPRKQTQTIHEGWLPSVEFVLCLLRIGNRRRSFAHEISISVKKRKKERAKKYYYYYCYQKKKKKKTVVLDSVSIDVRGRTNKNRNLLWKDKDQKQKEMFCSRDLYL